MIVYEFITNENDYSLFYLPIEEEKKHLDDFANKYLYLPGKVIQYWEPIRILEKEVRQLPDFALLEDEYIIVSEKAANLFLNIWSDKVELLPLLNDANIYYLLRVINTQNDILDLEESKVKRLPHTGKIISISDYVFKNKYPKEALIFKIPELFYEVFVLEEFIAIYEENNLKGLDFTDDEIVWVYSE